MSRIDRVEIHGFTYEVPNLGLPAHGAQGVGNWVYQKGSKVKASRYAVRIRTDDGLAGEYVTHWVGTPSAMAQSIMLALHLLGRDPESREQIYDDLKRELRAYDHMGHGPLDIALGSRRQEVRRAGRAPARRLSHPPADLRQHLPRPGGAGRPRQSRGVRRVRRSLQGARLRRLQDPRLARRRPQARGEERARRARARRRRHGADDRSGVRAAHLHGRASTSAAPATRPATSGTRTRIATLRSRPSATSGCARS